jgi:hypothetical protein
MAATLLIGSTTSITISLSAIQEITIASFIYIYIYGDQILHIRKVIGR